MEHQEYYIIRGDRSGVFFGQIVERKDREVTLTNCRRAPAVDPVTVFKQIGLVKEAFEMAKADLMQVVQCKDCLHWETTKCPLCIVEFSELPDGKLQKHLIHNFVEDDFWCKKGERRVDSADSV